MTSIDRRLAEQRKVVEALRHRLRFETAVLDRLEQRDGSGGPAVPDGRAFGNIADVLVAAQRRNGSAGT